MNDTSTTSPSSTAIRQELLEMVMRDLLGPAAGPDEEISERSVRDRYLVGMLAPKHQTIFPEEQDKLETDTGETNDEGTPDASVVPSKTMFPSSFGLTFSVDRKATAIQATVNWGHYTRQPSEYLTTDTGAPKLVWKRTPRDGTSEPIPLKAGRIRDWSPDPDVPEVIVQGLMRQRDDHWSVTLFLVNGQEEPERGGDAYWLFQPELIVDAPDGSPILHRREVRREPGNADSVAYQEDQAMAMLYRHQVEFAVGHGVSVHVTLAEGECNRAVRLQTKVAPECEVPRATPPTIEDFPKMAGLVVDMKELSETATADFDAKLRPLLVAYEAWIAERESELSSDDMAEYREPGRKALDKCRDALGRIEAGMQLLVGDEHAAEAFRFANQAMWRQRTRSLYAHLLRTGNEADLAAVDIPKNRSWYPFQLAFILLNLPGITKFDHPDRSEAATATADLLWYPTGGGKTEAYLGLSAYTMGLRRLQGTVEGREGEHGVAVLMRYTLRLLTIQQFQRAAALVCACEMIRRDDPAKWGHELFRIGLWVGYRVTPNTTDQSSQAVAAEHGQRYKGSIAAGSGSPAQLKTCPWCGTEIDSGRDIKVETVKGGRGRTLIYCGDKLGRCPFSPAKSPGEGLPVVVVDEEVYRLLPSMLIATVDKFAQMPWKGQVQMLFGQVEGRCERHGFRSPELDDSDSHPARKGGLPAAKTLPHPPIRPPDLIIQDELHLISGPLGSLVGLYETAIDRLCSWEVGGRVVRPKLIASTATIRRAGDQVHATFMRRVNVFPPHGLDVKDGFFSLQRKPSEDDPGRLYLGICAPGRRLKVALLRVYVAFLSAGQQLYEKHGAAADPWMTLAGYFSSMRELGGMRRLVEDDVRSRLGKMDERGLTKRILYLVDELTSRKGSTDIPYVLDQLEVRFDPETDARRKELRKQGKLRDLPARPIDVLLATNMVSVGVDVPRLGLMVVAGQPKTTAEYIQATSRVGRRFPGIVCTVYNWSRPRDLSHYETFEHYHSTFYKHVEALSVTPFSAGATKRGLTALLVSSIRLQGGEFNPNSGASQMYRTHPYVAAAIEAITQRAHQVGNGAEIEQFVRGELNERLDEWLAEAHNRTGGGVLGYDSKRDGLTVPLLRRPNLDPWDDFTCLMSLRDVEPSVGLILDDGGLDDDPSFHMAISEDTDADGEEVSE